MMFMNGDKVRYVGNKFRGEIGSRLGEVVAPVQNQPSAIVVDFGDNAYVCSFDSLSKVTYRPTEEKEVEVVRRRPIEDEDE
jgi:hypothetical protein